MLSQSITSPNIALIKYWGKYHDEYIIPINDSISLTLNSQDLCTTTTITFSKFNEVDSLTLNGTSQPISKRLANILKQAKQIGLKKLSSLNQQQFNECHFKIESKNSFPTASGLASSASGLASIAVCLNKLFGGCFDQKKVSELARLGSGSASRSIYGGLVRWKGVNQYPKQMIKEDQLQQLSKVCISEQVMPSEKLKQFRIIILLANQNKKQTSSTEGMKRSVMTSQFIKMRNTLAKQRINTLIQSLNQDDISTCSETIIRDSNSFHAICLDTYPPIHYLNDFSRQVMYLIDHVINPKLKSKIAYTFDAGPHAFVIVHQSEFREVFYWFRSFYKIQDNQLNQKAMNYKQSQGQVNSGIEYPKIEIIKPIKLWVTDVGQGPMDKFRQSE